MADRFDEGLDRGLRALLDEVSLPARSPMQARYRRSVFQAGRAGRARLAFGSLVLAVAVAAASTIAATAAGTSSNPIAWMRHLREDAAERQAVQRTVEPSPRGAPGAGAPVLAPLPARPTPPAVAPRPAARPRPQPLPAAAPVEGGDDRADSSRKPAIPTGRPAPRGPSPQSSPSPDD